MPLSSQLSKLSNRIAQILRYHRIDSGRIPGTEIIAHFAGWGACEAMLRENTRRGISLWGGDANCLNDPLEGRALIKFVEDILKRSGELTLPKHLSLGGPHSSSHPAVVKRPIADLSEAAWKSMHRIIHSLYCPPTPSASGWYEPRAIPASEVYLVSFCNDMDRLDLWRAYGEDGAGVCMVMPLEAAAKAVAKTDWALFRVMYDEAAMRRAWILLEKPLSEAWAATNALGSATQANTRKRILDAVSPVFHLYKHPQFATENEIRLVYQGGNPTPKTAKIRNEWRPVLETEPFFLKGAGCKIILGPRIQERNRKITSLQVWLKGVFGKNAPEVQISGVPYQ